MRFLFCFILSPGPVLSCEAATQTDRKPQLATVILRKSLRAKAAARSRPQSLIDYKSYIDTKLLVAKFLEQSSCNMTPDIHELVEDIKSVLKSDEEHMEEAITSASFLEQVRYKLLNRLQLWGRKGQLKMRFSIRCCLVLAFFFLGRRQGNLSLVYRFLL